MTAPSSGATKWAGPEDWEEHRSTIEQLYWVQDLTLQTVSEIMQNEYNFFATAKMYKSRFKTWGLRKNVKAREGESAEPSKRLPLRQRTLTSTSKGASPALTWGIVGPVRVHRSANIKKALAPKSAGRHVLMPGIVRSSGPGAQAGRPPLPPKPPMLRQVSTPEILRVPEECILAVVNYSHSRFETGAWAATDIGDAATVSGTWAGRASSAREALQQGRTRAGFRMLDICFQQLRDVLACGDVELLQKTLGVAFYLLEVGDDLALALVRYLAGLSAVVLGESHPLSRVWHVLHVLGVDGLRRHAQVVLEAQADTLTAWLGPDDKFLAARNLEVARSYHRWGVLSTERARDLIEKVIAQMLSNAGYWTWDYILWAQLELVTVYAHSKSYVEAEEILQRIGARLALEEGITIWTKDVYHKMRALVKENLGLIEEATSFHVGRLRVCLEMAGPVHRQTVRAKADLELHYRKIGQADIADRLREEFDAEWEKICEKEDKALERVAPDKSQAFVATPQFT